MDGSRTIAMPQSPEYIGISIYGRIINVYIVESPVRADLSLSEMDKLIGIRNIITKIYVRPSHNCYSILVHFSFIAHAEKMTCLSRTDELSFKN